MSDRADLQKLLGILDCTASKVQARAVYRLFGELRAKQTKRCATFVATCGHTISGKPFADKLGELAGLE